MRKVLLMLAVVLTTTIAFGQKKENKTDIQIGGTVYAPLAKNLDWNAKSWGQRVNFSRQQGKHLRTNLSFGFMQNKAGDVQMPLLVGVRRHLVKSIHIGLDGGMTFYNGKKGEFTYNPSVGVKINNKWCLEQSWLRTGKKTAMGLSLLYGL